MDLEALRRFIIVRRKRSPETARHMAEGVGRIQRKGFSLDRFHQNPALESETYLSRLLEQGATIWVYNNDLTVIRVLHDFFGYKSDLKYQQQPKTPPRTIPAHQLDQLLAYHHRGNQETNRLRRAMVVLMRYTGLRPSESVRLRLGDLNPERSTVSIRLSSKRGISGEIPVPRKLWRPRSPLMAYLRRRPTNHKTDRLWVTRQAGALNQDAYEKHMSEVRKAVGFRVTHTFLRHTIATELHAQGYDAVFIRLFLRHKSITSTLVYVETTHEDLIRKFHQKKRKRK